MTFREYVDLTLEGYIKQTNCGTYDVCSNETNEDVVEFFEGKLISGNFEQYTTYLYVYINEWETPKLPSADCIIRCEDGSFYMFYELEDYD